MSRKEETWRLVCRGALEAVEQRGGRLEAGEQGGGRLEAGE